MQIASEPDSFENTLSDRSQTRENKIAFKLAGKPNSIKLGGDDSY